MCRGLKQIFSSMRYRRTVQLLGLTDPQNSTSMAKCFALLLEPCKPKVDWVLQVIPRNCHRHSDMQSNFRRYLNKSQRKWKKIYIYSRFYEVSFLEQINCKWTYWKVISFSFSHWELLSLFFFLFSYLKTGHRVCSSSGRDWTLLPWPIDPAPLRDQMKNQFHCTESWKVHWDS